MSKGKERKRLLASLRSMVVPGVRVWLSKANVDNGKFGYRSVYQAWVWDSREGRKYSGIQVWTWNKEDLLWDVLQALYDYRKTFIKTAYHDTTRG